MINLKDLSLKGILNILFISAMVLSEPIIPNNALVDENGNYILDENNNFITSEPIIPNNALAYENGNYILDENNNFIIVG